jgi:hypothetical protein
MKKYLLVIVLALICLSVKAQRWGFEYGLNYLYAKPVGGMGVVIQRGDGVALNFGMVKPNGRFAFGVDINLAQYGRDKSRQEYEMEDGSLAPMDIIVSNSFATLMAYSRWYMTTKGLVRPFVVGKAGYSGYTTDLNIYDPDDNDHCKPVENDVLYEDGTFVASVGAGVKLDFASVFKKMTRGKYHLEGSMNFTQGGQVRYMSENADANHAHGNAPASDHVYAEFINTETQIIHEHHVGHLYRSPVQMTEIRVGFSMAISR